MGAMMRSARGMGRFLHGRRAARCLVPWMPSRIALDRSRGQLLRPFLEEGLDQPIGIARGGHAGRSWVSIP